MSFLGKIKIVMLKGEKGDQGTAGVSGDYSGLTNKPSINSVTLSGNKTGGDLGLVSQSDFNALDGTVDNLVDAVSDLVDKKIVEEGTSGNWTWRKWADGVIELFYAKLWNESISLITSNNLTYYEENLTLPVACKFITGSGGFANSRYQWIGCAGGASSGTAFSTELVLATFINTASASIDMTGVWQRCHFTGKWK